MSQFQRVIRSFKTMVLNLGCKTACEDIHEKIYNDIILFIIFGIDALNNEYFKSKAPIQ